MSSPADVPTFDAFMGPIIERLKAHGRSMTNEEMADDVARHMGLTDAQRALAHGKRGELVVDYRMAWARSYLKAVGALENSARGVWALTPKGAEMTEDDIAEVKRLVRQAGVAKRAAQQSADPQDPSSGAPLPIAELAVEDAWRDALMAQLLALHPSAFERLCQRLLREAGFSKVEVTGKTGDGGIDGTGVLRMNLLSFQVIFQCKRWQGSVGAPTVRDFRGAPTPHLGF